MYSNPYLNSPLIKKHFIDGSSNKQNVLLKEFNTNSKIFLSYAADEQDSDRCRGVAADLCL